MDAAHEDDGLAALADHIPGGIHRCLDDAHLTLLDMNKGFFALLGYTREEIRTRFHDRFLAMISPLDQTAVMAKIQALLLHSDTLELEYRVICRDGSQLWILDKAQRNRSADGTRTFYCMLTDITTRKKEQEALRLSLEWHKVIMDQTTDIIFEWDICADTLVFSSNWNKKFGYVPITHQITTRIPRSSNLHPEDIPAFIKITQDIARGVGYAETEFRIRNAHGWYCWFRIRVTAQYGKEGQSIKAIGVIIDIDTEKRQKVLLLELAERDALTGLYNKRTIQTLVEECSRQTHQQDYQMMMIIDVDNFKAVNDTYGHMCGDSMLAAVAAALTKLFRSSDLVGRVGGDEFLVYLPEISDAEAASAKATLALDALACICPSPGAASITCSMGIAFFPQRSSDYYAMYQCADQALYHIKDTGKNNFAFYTPSLCRGRIPCGLAHSAVGEIVDLETTNPVDETLARYVFELLYNAVDTETAVNGILEAVGKAYNVSRAYIFERSEDGTCCINTFEWCNEGVSPVLDHQQNLSYLNHSGDYLQNFDEKGVFYCRDIETLNPTLYAVLAPQGVASLLQCAILDDGCLRGYVGFDECGGQRNWTKEQVATLMLTANILSTFLVKLRLKEQLARFQIANKQDSNHV